MTNRLFLLLALFTLVFVGCPAPDEEGDNFGFQGNVFYTSSGEIRKIDLANGRITAIGEGHSPFVTRSAEVIASLPDVGLVRYSANGASRTTIRSGSNITDPQLSPSGSKIAYTHINDVYIIDAVTGAAIDSMLNVKRPQWISDTELLLHRGDELHLYRLSARTLTTITNIGSGRDPALSPDRSRIAFVDGKDLFTISIDGTNQKLIMSGHTELRYPAWSRDGERIVVKDGCDLKLFKVSGGMVQSFRGHFFSFTDAQCPDARQLSWR
jgi:hypothetical protein